MKENKNLERLFQEKFKDFQEQPPLESWDYIANNLNPKQRKKKPFGLLFGSIASVAVLALVFAYPYFADNKDVNNKIDTTENPTVLEEKTNTLQAKEDLKVTTDDVVEEATPKVIKEKNTVVKSATNTNIRESLVEEKTAKTKSNLVSGAALSEATFSGLKRSKATKSKPKYKRLQKPKTSNFITGPSIVKSTSKLKNKEEDSSTNIENKAIKKEKTNTNSIANEGFGYSVLKATDKEKQHWVNQQNKLKTEGTFLLDKDSTSTNLVLNKEESLVLQQLEPHKNVGKEAIEKELKQKWAVSAIIAPIVFNNTSNNSFLDAQYNASSSISNTTSTGLGLQYKINNRWSISTAVAQLDMSQHTENVLYRSQLNQNFESLPSVKREGFGTIIDFYDPADAQKFTDIETLNKVFTEGSLQQELRFVEVPLEVNYLLLDKKFKIDIIGGFSTFFLNQNNIYLQSNGGQMRIGEANNVNNTHFSSNIGLGIRYRFFNGFQANLQPMFKQQINTFNSNTGGKDPSFLGFYTGFSYLF